MEHARQHTHEDLIWNTLAALLLTTSVTMLTDFTHRLLAADPDGVGILSVSIQALFTVAATSTFTKAGWSSVQSLFSLFGIRAQSQGRWKVVLAGGLFAVVCPAWIWLPSKLAVHYNDQGFLRSATDPGHALEDYERAIALDPRLAQAHFNLGELYEGFYQYENAAGEYQKAIVADHTFVLAYNNLARVLLLEDKAMTALRITDDALALERDPNDKETEAAMRKNRAWAEYQLGFYDEGIADARLSIQSGPSSAAYCVLGKIYGKLERPAEGRQAWEDFTKSSASEAANRSHPMVEPDCKLLAQGGSNETQ